MTDKRLQYILILLILPLAFIQAQKTNAQYQEYINKYRDLAIEQMMRWKIPASITLAQALLESSAGNSDLAQKGNNLRNKMPWLDRKKDISRRRPATRMLQSIRQRTRQLRRPQPVSRTATKIQQALHTQNNRLQKMGTPAQGMRIRHKQHIRTATHQHYRDIPTLPL